MSCSNADSLISLYSGWGKEFGVLLDSDEAAKSSKKRYEEKFGFIVNDRIITLKDINSKWTNKNMETILSASDRLKIQKECFPDSKNFSKNMYNKSIQELLMRNKKIEVSDEVKNTFEDIYNALVNLIKK